MMLRELARRTQGWDTPLKLALGLALLLLALLLGLAFGGPAPVQLPARIGAFGLLLALQLLFFYGNRRDISPYHSARERFIAGDYEAARSILEALPENAPQSVDALVLLGNSYRRLGQLRQAQAALTQAVARKPQHPVALYSMGKLELVQGKFAAAQTHIEAARAAGAPDELRLELGQLCLLQGQTAQALQHFLSLRGAFEQEPAQALLRDAYLHELGEGAAPSTERLRAASAIWQAEAQTFYNSAYGEHLTQLLQAMGCQQRR